MTLPAPSRKVATQFIAGLLTWIVALVVTKLGIHESAAAAGYVSTAIGLVAGLAAGYLVREIPKLEAEAAKVPPHP